MPAPAPRSACRRADELFAAAGYILIDPDRADPAVLETILGDIIPSPSWTQFELFQGSKA